MSAAAPEIIAKGSNFIGLLNALEELKGPEARERVLAGLPTPIASALRFGQVVVMGWYPVEWYAELHAAVDHTYHGGPGFARKLSQHAVRADISKLHRFIVNMLSVETMFGQAHRLLALYWKGGTIERLEIAPGRARLRFVDWPGFTALIWEDLMGGMEGFLEGCGAVNGRCRPGRRMSTGSESMEIDVRWG